MEKMHKQYNYAVYTNKTERNTLTHRFKPEKN